MSKRLTKNEALDNLKRLLDAEDTAIETVAQMDVVMADAYNESEKADKHIQSVKDELNKAAEVIMPEKHEEPKKPHDTYGGKLKLDEGMADFKLHEDRVDGRSSKVYEDDDDEHLDFDMFDFITGLVTDTWPKPINPSVGVPARKFQSTGQDNYTEGENKGVPQVSTNGVDTITVYSNRAEDFEYIKRVCELYKFDYSGPTPKRSAHSHWNFSFDIKVPMSGGSYPESVEDYFADLFGGYTYNEGGVEKSVMYKIMPKVWVDTWQKKMDKINKEADKKIAERDAWKAVKDVCDQAIEATMDDDRDFEEHYKDLIARLKQMGLTFKQSEVKKYFFDNV